jgi:hypothetical protein
VVGEERRMAEMASSGKELIVACAPYNVATHEVHAHICDGNGLGKGVCRSRSLCIERTACESRGLSADSIYLACRPA